MFIYEIELPNGFTVDVDNEIENNKMAKKVELHQNSVVFYYDEVYNIYKNIIRVELQFSFYRFKWFCIFL